MVTEINKTRNTYILCRNVVYFNYLVEGIKIEHFLKTNDNNFNIGNKCVLVFTYMNFSFVFFSKFVFIYTHVKGFLLY